LIKRLIDMAELIEMIQMINFNNWTEVKFLRSDNLPKNTYQPWGEDFILSIDVYERFRKMTKKLNMKDLEKCFKNVKLFKGTINSIQINENKN